MFPQPSFYTVQLLRLLNSNIETSLALAEHFTFQWRSLFGIKIVPMPLPPNGGPGRGIRRPSTRSATFLFYEQWYHAYGV